MAGGGVGAAGAAAAGEADGDGVTTAGDGVGGAGGGGTGAGEAMGLAGGACTSPISVAQAVNIQAAAARTGPRQSRPAEKRISMPYSSFLSRSSTTRAG